MASRILTFFFYLLFSWAFFVSSLWMELPPEKPFSIVTVTILFIKLIFMASAVLYSVLGFVSLFTPEPEKETEECDS